MVRPPRRVVEIESLERFDELIAGGGRQARGWRVQDIDLSERTVALLGLDPVGSLWLGCTMERAAEDHLRTGGGLVFPEIPELPFDPYRSRLYSPDDLYDGLDSQGYKGTPDAWIYAWSRSRQTDVQGVVAATLHDQSIEDALDDHVAARGVVGVMGGHAVERGQPGYLDSAHLGATLASAGHLVASGGGPGAMEATNLGAYLHTYGPEAIDDAVTMLSKVPSFTPSTTAWARAAFEVRRTLPHGADSLGIPTWYYGHEPPNAFASSIAKYFQNSVREETLLRHCSSGVVFMPGAGGTVQEVFQTACENYYAALESVAPMVLVGTEYWTTELPVWPLLRRLMRERPAAGHIHLVDAADEVAAILAAGPVARADTRARSDRSADH